MVQMPEPQPQALAELSPPQPFAVQQKQEYAAEPVPAPWLREPAALGVPEVVAPGPADAAAEQLIEAAVAAELLAAQLSGVREAQPELMQPALQASSPLLAEAQPDAAGQPLAPLVAC